MTNGEDGCGFEASARRAFVDLVYETLPSAAGVRGWPVTTPAGFERVLLDHVLGAPFETCLTGPSGASAELFDLILAVETGGRMLEGRCCVAELDRRSRAMRGAAEAGALPHVLRRAAR